MTHQVFGATPQEGTRVRVEPIDTSEALLGSGDPTAFNTAPGDPRAIAAAGVAWAGRDEELDHLLAEVQQLRDEDLK
jgi:hypothetical protein